MENYKALLRSPPFHFLIGPDRQKLTIHAGLFHGLSAPLDSMINNGYMKEATSRTAAIEDIDEDTFIAFCEFCYKGNYTTPCRKEHEDDSHVGTEDGTRLIERNTQQTEQNPGSEPLETEPEPEPEPVPVSEPEPEPETSYSYKWDAFTSKAQRKKHRSSPPLEIEIENSIYIRSPYERRWSEFRGLRFTGDEATSSPNPDLLAHAKIYVFATRYLVDTLREQSLKSLHRDLSGLSLSGQTIPHLLDLLQYTYEQTGRQEPGGCSLRDLVTHYVSCEVRTLIEITRVRLMLDEYGEMASELVVKLAR